MAGAVTLLAGALAEPGNGVERKTGLRATSESGLKPT